MSIRRESKLRAFAAKVRGFLRGSRHDGEFDDEIQGHLQMLAENFMAKGMSRKEAAAVATCAITLCVVFRARQH